MPGFLEKGVIHLLADKTDYPGQTEATVSHQPPSKCDRRLRILVSTPIKIINPIRIGSVEHKIYLPLIQSIPGCNSPGKPKNFLKSTDFLFEI
jgi:hypothetical protein